MRAGLQDNALAQALPTVTARLLRWDRHLHATGDGWQPFDYIIGADWYYFCCLLLSRVIKFAAVSSRAVCFLSRTTSTWCIH